jgi:hypothetical protein
MTPRNIALRTSAMLPWPYKPFINNIRDDQGPLRTYSTRFAMQRMMFSRNIVPTIMSLWRDYMLAYQLREPQNRPVYSLHMLRTSFPEGGGNITIIVIVSLIGSLRKGYGLTDNVASYSST